MYVQEEMPTACVRFTIPFCDANRERETDSKTKKKKKTKQELWHYCDHLLASVFLSFFFFFWLGVGGDDHAQARDTLSPSLRHYY